MGVVDRLHMRSAIKVLLAFTALAGKDLGTENKEVVGVDSGKVKRGLAEV